MFSGIVEGVGQISEVRQLAGATRLAIEAPFPPGEVRLGASVAVDGVCLTVVAQRAARLEFDAIAETLARSTLAAARVGRRVNLERSLRVGDRLDGHLVLGHVDAVVPVLGLRRAGADRRLRLGLPAAVRSLVAHKGSVALDGVSLTVAAVDRGGFEVALVPFTLERTTLGAAAVGDRLNLEADVLARYLERMLETSRDREHDG